MEYEEESTNRGLKYILENFKNWIKSFYLCQSSLDVRKSLLQFFFELSSNRFPQNKINLKKNKKPKKQKQKTKKQTNQKQKDKTKKLFPNTKFS